MKSLVAAAVVLSTAGLANAQFVMMPDSSNNRLVLFSPVDGSVVNPDFFSLAGGTQVHALQVGDEIWVSEQVGDRVSRWSMSGSPLGQIGGGTSGGLDNIRGMALVNDTLHVTNSGTANGAPGNSVVTFDLSGNQLGVYSTVGLAPSPFGILAHRGDLLVSSSSANDDIHRFTLGMSTLGTFHNSTSLNFAQQMTVAANGDILAAGFSSNNVVRLDPDTGALISSFAASGARGVYQLENGNIMWTNSAGAHVYDVNSGTSSLVYAGGGRYLAFVLLPGAGGCPADWNDDEAVNSGDITAFLGDWLTSLQQGTLVGDFNGDGQVNSGDITAFLSAWLDAVQHGC